MGKRMKLDLAIYRWETWVRPPRPGPLGMWNYLKSKRFSKERW